MKTYLKYFGFLFVCSHALLAATVAPTAPMVQKTQIHESQDWKGQASPAEWTVAALTGLGVFESQGGYTLQAAFAKKVIPDGFIPEIANPIFLEAAIGPLWVLGSTAFAYSTHIRWDFQKDDRWTLYGLGGFAGNITGESLGSHFTFLPRFGVGAIMHFNPELALRAEVSHEFMGAGVSFQF